MSASRRNGLLGAAAALLTACAPGIGTYNALTPQDGEGVRTAASIAFGPHPRQRLDVYAPRRGAQSAPVIVFFYGGSWRSGRREEYAFVGRALAARGYLAIVADYRLTPEVRFPAFLEDGAAAVRWAHDHAARFGGDGNRIVLMGHSAGAYNAVMLTLDETYLSGAAAPLHVVRGAIGLSGPYDFYPFDVQSTQDAFGAARDPSATQPVRFARADAPPLFLAWGERDTLVGRRNIRRMSEAVRAAGGRVETQTCAGLGHAGTLLALSRPFRDRSGVFNDALAFADRVTQVGSAPAPQR